VRRKAAAHWNGKPDPMGERPYKNHKTTHSFFHAFRMQQFFVNFPYVER